MPLDVCPGAQHLRPPSARLLSLAMGAYIARAQQGRQPYRDRVVAALEVFALVEHERENGGLVIPLVDGREVCSAFFEGGCPTCGTVRIFDGDDPRVETSESADPVRTDEAIEAQSVTDPVGALGELAARAEADDENELRSADCIERDEPGDPRRLCDGCRALVTPPRVLCDACFDRDET